MASGLPRHKEGIFFAEGQPIRLPFVIGMNKRNKQIKKQYK
jgi:hypothetical protein